MDSEILSKLKQHLKIKEKEIAPNFMNGVADAFAFAILLGVLFLIPRYR